MDGRSTAWDSSLLSTPELEAAITEHDSPIADMTLWLRRDAGIAISVRPADTKRPLDPIYVFEKIGERADIRFLVPLDGDGEGYLPSALANSALSFSASGFNPVVVDPWNGERLDLQLERHPPTR
jgi:hypothetical protein